MFIYRYEFSMKQRRRERLYFSNYVNIFNFSTLTVLKFHFGLECDNVSKILLRRGIRLSQLWQSRSPQSEEL